VTQGFSPRTRQDAQLIRFGETAARVLVEGVRNGAPLELAVTLRQGQAKEARVNGAKLPSAESLRREVATLVFTPDRLTVVKGGPAARRAYFDRALGRLFPARAAVPQDYLAALAQRNAALRRVQLGLSGRDAIEPWTEQVATLGADLVERRRETLAALAPAFAQRAGELGLTSARLGYDAAAPTRDALESRLARDLERGVTGLGPHLDDVLIASGDRDLRQYGSQGEQRLAVLSLLLAEAELLPAPPLLLLDDVLSELDPGRRQVLAERVAGMGQTMITATHRSALPIEPAQIVEVEAGSAR
jgi:DNA replication and repair protein RecF